jgi:RNA polymerase-binding transcription factor DksA
MADIVDAADPVTELWASDAERRQRGKSDPALQPGYEGFDGLTCVDCAENIPAARLAMGRVRCIECQSTLEWETKVGRR